MDLREIGCEGVDCIQVPQNRGHWRTLLSAVMKLRVPKKKDREFVDKLRDSQLLRKHSDP
jgi:hypothetical protein